MATEQDRIAIEFYGRKYKDLSSEEKFDVKLAKQDVRVKNKWSKWKKEFGV